MTTPQKTVQLKIPGKVVINGSYIVLLGEYARCVAINKFLHTKISVCDSEVFGLSLYIKNRETLTYMQSGDNYLCRIVETTLKYFKIFPKKYIHIEGFFDDGFFKDMDVKMGLGSSACIFVAVVFSIIYCDDSLKDEYLKDVLIYKQVDLTEKLVSVIYDINKLMNPKSSGCDIMTCLLGPIDFSFSNIAKYKPNHKYLILGSFGKSTDTRKMLNLIKNKDWLELKGLNDQILVNENKYEEYLHAMRSISELIVPDKQYEVLVNTFKYSKKCGISGAGGEDAVWCMCDNPDRIIMYWNEVFTYIEICELIDHGMMIE